MVADVSGDDGLGVGLRISPRVGAVPLSSVNVSTPQSGWWITNHSLHPSNFCEMMSERMGVVACAPARSMGSLSEPKRSLLHAQDQWRMCR
jgi:hypothetical protein